MKKVRGKIRYQTISLESSQKTDSTKLCKCRFPTLPVSVGDPDPHIFGPPGSGSFRQSYGSGSGSFPFLKNNACKKKFLHKIFAKIKFKADDDAGQFKKKII
jgi:hypothetical protein